MFNEPRIKERKSAAARPPHSSVPPSLRLGRPYFMLIFRLENALKPGLTARAHAGHHGQVQIFSCKINHMQANPFSRPSRSCYCSFNSNAHPRPVRFQIPHLRRIFYHEFRDCNPFTLLFCVIRASCS
jgi:hypothetical protein